MTLKELAIGKTAVIRSVGGEGALRQHFLDMGLIPDAEVTLVKFAPMGDPLELRIHGYELTLRLADAEKILVQEIPTAPASRASQRSLRDIPHPGLGEGGKYHAKAGECPLPEEEMLTFALVGNQNCGKTTLFNRLTGSNQHVGNFPGVTVDRKDGQIIGHANTRITDLPGIYSMSPYSSEEIVTRQFILQEKPRGIINIVDASNIERNLYLTMQLLELDIPMVVALNMMDEVRQNGGSILINEIEPIGRFLYDIAHRLALHKVWRQNQACNLCTQADQRNPRIADILMCFFRFDIQHGNDHFLWRRTAVNIVHAARRFEYICAKRIRHISVIGNSQPGLQGDVADSIRQDRLIRHAIAMGNLRLF